MSIEKQFTITCNKCRIHIVTTAEKKMYTAAYKNGWTEHNGSDYCSVCKVALWKDD